MDAFLTDCSVAGTLCCNVMRELRCDGTERFAPGVREPPIGDGKR